MRKLKTNNSLEEFKREFFHHPEVIEALRKRLVERKEEIIDFCQINGDHLHYAIASKDDTYFYGIWVKDKNGNESTMIRVCNYLDPNRKRELIFRRLHERD